MTMRVISVEKAELVAYQLKGVAQIWYNHWKEGRLQDVGTVDWEKCKASITSVEHPLDVTGVSSSLRTYIHRPKILKI